MPARDSRVHNYPPRWNAAPSQELLVIRRNHQTGEVSLDPLRWGLIPYWCNDPTGGRKPINAKCETVRDLPTFRDAYRRRRCIVPVDGFFEWKAIKGQKAKQPYAIAMKDGVPFGIAGIWENWKDPTSGEWTRTFAIITTDANELVGDIHDRNCQHVREDARGMLRGAAQTRMVSAGDFWPSQQELSRYLKYMARTRIPEFESDMPSHAVGLSQVRSPAIVMHRVALEGRR